MALSFFLGSADQAGCPCYVTTESSDPNGIAVTPPVYEGRPHDTAALTACYHNAVVPLAGIVRLQQAPDNRFVPLADVEALTAILPGCSVIPSDGVLSRALYATLSAVVPAVPVGRLLCRPDADAAQVCASGLSGL